MNNIQYPGPQQEYKVLVRCFTYNQSKYIEDALNGFVMQQTNFPFVCLVMDDASTDGEQDVIRAWMERECDMNKAETIDIPTSIVIIVPHKTNTSCTFAFYLLKYNLYGTGDKKMNHVYPWREKCEYEALCEGDDYWIDPLKLQKQVDFMEANPDYSLCFTNMKILNEDSGKIDENPLSSYLNDSLPEDKEKLFYYIMLGLCRIQTLSVLYNLSFFSMIRKNDRAFMMGDTPLWLDLSQYGRFHYLHDKTACYRVNTGSVSRNPSTYNKFRLSMFEMRIYYCEKYGYKVPKIIKREYNRSVIRAILDDDDDVGELTLSYPLYKMNLFQEWLSNMAIKRKGCKCLFCILWRIEYVFQSLSFVKKF